MSANTNDSASESDDPLADSSPTAPADKPHRKHSNQPPDARPEICADTSIEADDPVPGLHSTLGSANAACLADKTLIDTSEANLETLASTKGHPVQVQWWKM